MSYKQKGQSKTKYVKKYKYHASLVLNITLFIVLSISVFHRLTYAAQFQWSQPQYTFEIKTQIEEVEVVKYDTKNILSMLDGIHFLETNRGKNTNPNALHNLCKDKGMSNEYGYGGMQLKICFEDEKAAKARVTLWLVEKLEQFDGNVGKTLCYYNLGKAVSTCKYYENYLKSK